MDNRKALLAAAVALALTGAATAQSPGSTGTRPPAGSPSGSPAATPSPAKASHQLNIVRLSKLDGVNVYDAEGKRIGEVDDVVIDPATGRIQHALVTIGGIMGVGGKTYAVPTKDLSIFSMAADDSVPVRAALGSPPDTLTEAKRPEKDSPNVMASKLMGTDLADSKGEEVGEIEDIIADLQSGEAQYAMVEMDDDIASDDKLFAVKLSELKKAEKGRKMVLDVTKESASALPSVEKKGIDKADLSQAKWLQAAGDKPGASGSGGSTPAGGSAEAGKPEGSTSAAGKPAESSAGKPAESSATGGSPQGGAAPKSN